MSTASKINGFAIVGPVGTASTATHLKGYGVVGPIDLGLTSTKIAAYAVVDNTNYVAGAYQAWRLYVTRGFSGDANIFSNYYIGSQEIQLRESIGGAQAAIGGAAAASTTASGSPAAAFDGLVNAGWLASVKPSWIGYDYGFGNPYKKIVEVALYPYASGVEGSIADFQLQYQEATGNWVTAFSVVDMTGWSSSAQVKTYSANSPAIVAKRCYRINVTAANGDSYVVMNKLAMRTTTGGGDICIGGQGIASSQVDFTYQPNNLYDASATTYWGKYLGNGPQWAGYEFSSPVDVAEIAITTATVTQGPKNFTWEYWDGTTWQVLQTFTNVTGYAANVPLVLGVVSAPGSSVTADTIRRPMVFTST